MESTSTDYSTPEKDKKKPQQTPKTDKVGDARDATPPVSTKSVNATTLKNLFKNN
tara:strand:- start:96 stop:260 length:165 start_codon:yes stop_codon:yes gene_type:complete